MIRPFFAAAAAFAPTRSKSADCNPSARNSANWRRNNLETIDKFLEFLSAVNEHHGAAKVQVVAHSMGGLVSFVALNRRPDLLWPRLFRATAHAELGQAGPAEEDFAEALRQAADPLTRYVVLTNRSAF